MFERFTERARQVVVLAQDEARLLRHNYTGTEHILLGLLREERGLAARVLESLGVTIEEARAQVARVIGQGDEVPAGMVPFTPRAKRVLELSLREALALGHNHIGTEHVLLGLARERQGVAARILLDFGADEARIRDEVVGMLSGRGRRPRPTSPELERLRAEKEAAIDEDDLERAAALRDEECRLHAELAETSESAAASREDAGAGRSRVYAWSLPPVAFGLGLLLGWLIWG